jgi:hypothetical protein
MFATRLRLMGTPLTILLIEPQQPHREGCGREICEPAIGRDHGGDARRIIGRRSAIDQVVEYV